MASLHSINGNETFVEYDVIDDEDDEDMMHQQHFVTINCNDKNKKKKGPFNRLGKSIRNLFSCTSSRATDVT